MLEERPDLYLKFGEKPLLPQDPQIVRFRAISDAEVLATTWDLARQQMLGPAITRQNRDKGTVVYIGSSLEAVYEETHIPAVRESILGLLDPYLGTTRRYRIPADRGLMAQYYESSSGGALHLIANAGDQAKKLHVDECYIDVEQISVAIKIPNGRNAASVELMRAGQTLRFSEAEGWIDFVIERVRIYEIVFVRFS